MGAFDIKSTFQSGLLSEDISLAYDQPFKPTFWDDTFSLSFKNAVQHDFGIGSVIRDLRTPRGVPGVNNGLNVEDLLRTNPITGSLVQGYEAARNVIGAQTTGAPMTKNEYEQSPMFRKEVPWDPSMTTDRAAALADQADEAKVAQYWGEKRPLTALGAEFLGGAVDPINFVPLLGEETTAAAAVRVGSFAAHLLSSSANAAISTGAFGALTASVRKQYGDDVSFQGILNEVAMSAVIGGAFGLGMYGIAKGIGKGVNAMVKASAQRTINKMVKGSSSIENIAEARAMTELAADMLANRGEIDMPETMIASQEKINAQANVISAPERAALVETAHLATADQPGRTVTTPSGFTVEAHPEIVDLRTLTQASGANQVRDRSRFGSEAWIETTAAKLDPSQLLPERTAVTGAPLVGPDGAIDSGNGRTRLILKAAEAYPDKYQAYLGRLRAEGFTVPEAPNGEVWGLVMRRDTPLSDPARAAYNADANTPIGAMMSPAELAQMDAAALTDDTLDLLKDGPVTSKANDQFVREFIGAIPQTSRAMLLDSSGALSTEGVRRVENAIVASAFGKVDPRVVERFSEATDENSRTIVGAMSDVAPKWAKMARMFTNHALEPEFDPTYELTQALEAITGWRNQAVREGRPVHQIISEGMRQLDLLAGMSPEAKAMVQAFYKDDSFRTAIGRDKLAKLFDRITENTMSLGQPQLFGRPGVSKLEIIQSASDNGSRDLFAPASALGFPEGDGGNAAPEGGGAGGQAAQGQRGAGAGQAAQPTRLVGGVSIQQSAETQGVDFIPTDRDMAKVEGEIIQAAKEGGKASIKAMSTEGRYGGVERSIDLEVKPKGEFDVAPLWNKLKEIGARARQDSVFLANEVTDDRVDPVLHRPGIELNFATPVPRDQLDAALKTLADNGVEFLTVTVGGKPKKAGAMADATGVRILYMPEFDRRYGMGDDLTMLDDAALHDHMLAKADEMRDQVATVSAGIEGVTGRVAWFDTDVAFSHEYAGETDGGAVKTGRSEKVSGKAGGKAWAGKSVREGLEAADRQLQFVSEQEAAADIRGQHAPQSPQSLEEQADAAQPVAGAAVSTRTMLPELASRVRGKFLFSIPKRSLVELHTAAAEAQGRLAEIGNRLALKYGAEFKDPGLKKLASAERKMVDKAYDDPRRMTDLARAGFVVNDPAVADSIARDFASEVDGVIDEGWFMNKANYFDRKLLVKMPNGTIAEVQFWHPEMFDRKEFKGGHLLYEKARSLEAINPDDPEVMALYGQMQEIYRTAIRQTDPAWRPLVEDLLFEAEFGMPMPGNVASNAEGVNLRPVSNTDSLETFDQSAPSETTANAPSSETTAGLPSQSKNSVSIPSDIGTLPEKVEPIKPPPEPEPPEVTEAAARVGKPDTIDEIAELAGVDPKTGEFPELKDVEQIGVEGRLTNEDRQIMEQAKGDYDNAVAYAKALEAAVSCII
jgi:hypothetical protein